MKPYINVLVDPAISRGIKRSFELDKNCLLFSLYHDTANISVGFKSIEKYVGRKIGSLVNDLLDIAVIVYMSDRYVERRQGLYRDIGIVMPVRNPDLWNSVKEKLIKLISFLVWDYFDIYFLKRRENLGTEGNFNSGDNCVCLLSGGLDSFAGAKTAIDAGYLPIFVSHYSSPRTLTIQKRLISFINGVYNKKFQHIPVYATRRKSCLPRPPPQIITQFARSFLFLSLATALALESKISKVFMFENGPLAMNIPVSEARVNTKTAHPKFLDMYGGFIKDAFGVSLDVQNPFLYKTKGEVVSLLKEEFFEQAIKDATSCFTPYASILAKRKGLKEFKGKHCGRCFPCINRRVAIHNSGLWESDDDYVIDIFNEYPKLDRKTITTMMDVFRFCDSIENKSIGELFLQYPDFSLNVKGVKAMELVKMYKRFAIEVKKCFYERGNAKLVSDLKSLSAR